MACFTRLTAALLPLLLLALAADRSYLSHAATVGLHWYDPHPLPPLPTFNPRSPSELSSLINTFWPYTKHSSDRDSNALGFDSDMLSTRRSQNAVGEQPRPPMVLSVPKGKRLTKYLVGYTQIARKEKDTGDWYIGFRHKNGVHPNDTVSPADALIMLDEDILAAEATANRVLKVPLKQPLFDLLVSFVMSADKGSAENSTVVRLINAGQMSKVPEALTSSVFVTRNGVLVKSRHLEKRRRHEAFRWELANRTSRRDNEKRRKQTRKQRKERKRNRQHSTREIVMHLPISDMTQRAPRRQVSDRGLNLVKSFEGLRLAAYKDSAGIPTIGYGHIRNVRMGQTITEARASQFLRQDMGVAESAVNRYVKVPLTQNEFDALASFTFNLGAGSLQRSSLLKNLNAGRKHQVPAGLKLWNKARVNGRLTVLPGLKRRREAEAALWSRG